MNSSRFSLYAAAGCFVYLLTQAPDSAAAGQANAEVRGHEHSQTHDHGQIDEHTHDGADVHRHTHGDVSGTVVAQAALVTQPETPQAGELTTLTFKFTDGTGQPLETLITHHARKLHVVIVSEDMRVLGHIHPRDFGEPIERGEASVHFAFPRNGRYIVAADVMTEHGPYAERFLVEVAGAAADTDNGAANGAAPPRFVAVEAEGGDRYTAPILLDGTRKAGGYELSLARPDRIEAGEPATFRYRIVKGGAPVTDLRLFLNAPLHLAVVKEDLQVFLHRHGMVAERGQEGQVARASHDYGHTSGNAPRGDPGRATFGPELSATVTFPEPGRYYLFGQAAHGERLLVSRFPVEVR